jgi:hypothetical protein
MSILLTDSIFPNKYAKWRLVEIHSFMNTYKADILVLSRISSYANVSYEFDYDILKSWDFPFDQYDIYIFNPSWNHIQNYNSPDFNGIAFNGKWPADYLFRHKSLRDSPLTLDIYKCIYHIFLMNYTTFNSRFSYPKENQIIHCYPGGGYLGSHSIQSISPKTHCIPTQEFVHSAFPSNYSIFPIYGGPFMYEKESLIYKSVNKETPLTVCFTSMGSHENKGAAQYLSLVNLWYTKYSDIPIRFISIGNCLSSPHIKAYSPLDQHALSVFYREHVDIILNLETGLELNGFPLGCEAILQGVILLTTDVHNQNQKNNYNLDPFHIISFDIESILEKILYLHHNRDFLETKSIDLQEKIHALFSYTNTMKKLFSWIDQKFLLENLDTKV